MKKCCGCKIFKEKQEFGFNKSHFDGLAHYCKLCTRDRNRLWRKNNPEKASNNTKQYQKKNRKYLSDYRKQRRKNNIEFGLADKIRSRLRSGLKHALLNKTGKTIDYLGCSFQELKNHLEKQFIKEMNWGNHGSYWHIDHIIPLSFCKKNDKEFMKTLTHYTNLRPLTKDDNYKKGNKIDLTLAQQYGIIIPDAYIDALILKDL